MAAVSVIRKADQEVQADLDAIEERATRLDVKWDAGRLSAEEYGAGQAGPTAERVEVEA